ncbi:MAG: LysR substrate-binding domain-containing protein, partial [Pseudomonadota bacterium]
MSDLRWSRLTAFEAAARHRNFTRAAEELSVLQPAVSRCVAALEAELGVTLLHRTRPRVTLSRDGELLYRAVSGGMQQINAALEDIRRRPNSNTLTINTTIGFASCYLMKRLPSFRAAHPDIAIELVSRDQNDAYDADADVVVVFDHPANLPGIRHQRIFHESMIAVTSPELAAHLGDNLEELANQPLLYLTMGIHADDWIQFFSGTELTPRQPAPERKFTSFMVYLQAALNGDGVILGWETLLRDHLEQGHLQRVSSHRVDTERGYFACVLGKSMQRSAAHTFLDWSRSL